MNFQLFIILIRKFPSKFKLEKCTAQSQMLSSPKNKDFMRFKQTDHLRTQICLGPEKNEYKIFVMNVNQLPIL